MFKIETNAKALLLVLAVSQGPATGDVMGVCNLSDANGNPISAVPIPASTADSAAAG